MNDSLAMRAIHVLLDGTEWSADTLESIASIVQATGREVRSPARAEPEEVVLILKMTSEPKEES